MDELTPSNLVVTEKFVSFACRALALLLMMHKADATGVAAHCICAT